MGKKDCHKKPRSRSASESSSDSSHSSKSCEMSLEDMYADLKHKLLQDKSLQVGGCDAYGCFYSVNSQQLPQGAAIQFDISQNTLNIDRSADLKNLYVRRDGAYLIILHITPDQASQWTLFLNGIPQFDRTCGTFNSSGQLTITYMINLKKDDNICVRNYISSSTAVAIPQIAGGNLPGANVEIVIKKIAPYPYKKHYNNQDDNNSDNKLSHKLKKKFNVLLKWLLKDPQIMITGTDVYGSAYSTNTQIVQVNDSILFDYNQNLLNMTHTLGTGDLTVSKDGMYFFAVILESVQSCQFTIFVNGSPVTSTTTGINKGASVLQLRQLIELKAGDVVSVRNYTSASGAVTIQQSAGGTLTGINAEFILLRLSPPSAIIKNVEQKSAFELEEDCLYKQFKTYLLNKDKLDLVGKESYFILNSAATYPMNLEDPVLWSFAGPSKNVSYTQGYPTLTINEDGVYKLIFDLEAYQPSQFTFYVNNVPIPSTIAGTSSGSGQVSIRQLLELHKGDVLQVKNHSSFLNPVVTILNPGGNNSASNAIFAGYRLGPIQPVKPPCPPNPPNPPKDCDKKKK